MFVQYFILTCALAYTTVSTWISTVQGATIGCTEPYTYIQNKYKDQISFKLNYGQGFVLDSANC